MSFTNDCEKVMRHLLAEGPSTSFSIATATGLSQLTTDRILADLVTAKQVESRTTHVKGIKVAKFHHKEL